MKFRAIGYCVLLTIACVYLTGCATISGSGSTQSVSVQTFAADGNEVEGVKCDMTNDEGTWFVLTPGSTIVHRSNKDLQVICKKTGMDVGTANVVSRTKGNMWGNILLGGGVGAIIDHNNGTAYEYPGLFKIFMGQSNQHIDEKSSKQAKDSASANEAKNEPQNSTLAASNISASQNASISNQTVGTDNMEDAKKKCGNLGFIPTTEQFGSCVLKLMGK